MPHPLQQREEEPVCEAKTISTDISDKAEEIAEIILTDVDRGATGVKVQGMYSKEEKKMLICVVTKKEIVELIDIVHKIDPSAFVIVNDVHEVRGEGFIEITQ